DPTDRDARKCVRRNTIRFARGGEAVREHSRMPAWPGPKAIRWIIAANAGVDPTGPADLTVRRSAHANTPRFARVAATISAPSGMPAKRKPRATGLFPEAAAEVH